MISEAGSTSPSAETLSRYEISAGTNPADRESIISGGFWGWLLASGSDTTTGSTTATHKGHVPLRAEPTGKELVILVANLIGIS